MTRRAVALAAVAFAGCGSSAPATTSQRAARRVCPRSVAAAVGPGAGARVVSDDPGTLVCDYAAHGARVRVTIDTLPQAYERWNRAQVETWQNYAGWNKVPDRAPRLVGGLGLGAFWIPHDRRLVTTAGGRLVTVIVLAPGRRGGLRLATRAARPVLPPAHGAPAASHGP